MSHTPCPCTSRMSPSWFWRFSFYSQLPRSACRPRLSPPCLRFYFNLSASAMSWISRFLDPPKAQTSSPPLLWRLVLSSKSTFEPNPVLLACLSRLLLLAPFSRTRLLLFHLEKNHRVLLPPYISPLSYPSPQSRLIGLFEGFPCKDFGQAACVATHICAGVQSWRPFLGLC